MVRWVRSAAVLAAILVVAAAAAAEEECPVDCECHHAEDHWLADCSGANLTSVPTGLSPKTSQLILEDNSLTEIDADLPEGLRELSLAGNSLANVTKDSFQNLSRLSSLDLSQNSITFIPPDIFEDNEELSKLTLYNNNLDEVDGPFLISPNLTILDLHNCELKAIGDTFFSHMKTLKSLDLSGNPLNTLSAKALAPLTELVHLKLNQCNLSSIQDTTFLKLGSLKTLELTLNDLGPKVNWAVLLDGVPLLETLDVTASGITHLPENVFSTNTILKNLDLSENKLSDLVVATTLGHNLRYLNFLNLSDCQLSGPLSQDAFANATKLQTLILSGNSLRAEDLSEALTPLTNLTKLSLRNCSLTNIPDDTFESLIILEDLDLSHNPLGETPISFLSPLNTLQILDMSHSNLQHIKGSTFSNMTSLKQLILSENPLKTIDPGLFGSLTNLRVLALDHCGLSTLKSTVFQDGFHYPELEVLRLGGNRLEVPEKGEFLPKQLRSLHTLDLNHCNISYLSKENLKNFNKLTKISLGGNRLADDSLGLLEALPKLKEVDLSHNNLKIITPAILKFNKDLESVRLAGNPWRCGCYARQMWLWAKEKGIKLDGRASLTCQFHRAGPPGLRPSSGTLSWSRFSRDPEACASPKHR